MNICGMQFCDTGDVTVEDLFEEAIRQHPGINLAKTIEKGRMALERASDPTVDLAEREEAWRKGLAFAEWMTALFHAAHARKKGNAGSRVRTAKGSATAPLAVVCFDKEVRGRQCVN